MTIFKRYTGAFIEVVKWLENENSNKNPCFAQFNSSIF